MSAGWIVFCVVLGAAWLAFQFRGIFAASSNTGSSGIGAVSVGLNVGLLAVPLGPPIVLILAWLVARWNQ